MCEYTSHALKKSIFILRSIDHCSNCLYVHVQMSYTNKIERRKKQHKEEEMKESKVENKYECVNILVSTRDNK